MKINPRIIAILLILAATIGLLMGLFLPKKIEEKAKNQADISTDMKENREVKLIDTWWRTDTDYEREFVCVISGDTVKGVEAADIIDLLMKDKQYGSAIAVINGMRTCRETIEKEEEVDQVRMELVNKEDGVIEIRYDYFGL